MKVGVIITCHNEREWIAQAIYSALNQSRYPDRVVVVDDGSTDESMREIRAWHDAGPVDVEALTVTHRGMAAARNAGLMAVGDCDYVVHLDGDDWLEPNFIEEALLPTKRHPCDAVVTNMVEDDALYTPPFVDLASMLERCELPSCALFWRDALVGVGGFRSDLGGDCDWGMWVELLTRGANIGYASLRTAYNHRIRPGSLTERETPEDRARHHEIIRRLACQYPR